MPVQSTVSIVPDRAAPPVDATPKLHQATQRQLVAIEGEAYEASTELVRQRDDLTEADFHDARHDEALDAVLRIDGLPPLARELVRVAQAADRAEDEAIERANGRRERAHGHTRRIAGRVERALTGRPS